MATEIKNAITEAGSLNLEGKVQKEINSAINSALAPLSPFNDFGKYMTGSRAVIKVNGKLFGFAFGVTYNIETSHEENKTIDDYVAHELIPTRISINGTLSMWHIPGRGPTVELVQANLLSFLMHKYITIEISDQTTGQTIFKTEQAVITSKTQDLQAGELSTIKLHWKALGWVDEMTPEIPQEPSQNLIDKGVDAIKGLF